MAFLLNRDLHELAVLQKRIHAGIVVGRLRRREDLARDSALAKHARQQHGGKHEVRSDHVRIKAWKDGSACGATGDLDAMCSAAGADANAIFPTDSESELPGSKARNASYN